MFLILATLAHASSSYPGVVAEELSVDTPACTLCHEGAPTIGTVTTPFGAALMDLGLTAQDDATLAEVLAELEAEGTDSDGDGVGDIQELLDGSDPNSSGATITPVYGCVGSTRPGGPVGMAALLSLALVWGFSRARPLE